MKAKRLSFKESIIIPKDVFIALQNSMSTDPVQNSIPNNSFSIPTDSSNPLQQNLLSTNSMLNSGVKKSKKLKIVKKKKKNEKTTKDLKEFDDFIKKKRAKLNTIKIDSNTQNESLENTQMYLREKELLKYFASNDQFKIFNLLRLIRNKPDVISWDP